MKPRQNYLRQYYLNNRDEILRRSKERYEANRSRKLASAKRYYRSRSVESLMLERARRRAKQQGVDCTLVESDITIPDVCPVFGFNLVVNAGGSTAAANSPSLDRIRPELGYIPGNVRVISYKANAMKSNASTTELLQFAIWILKTFGRPPETGMKEEAYE